jgi:hypothetical protein
MERNPHIHPDLDAFRQKERQLFRVESQSSELAHEDENSPAKSANGTSGISFSDILNARKRKLGAAFHDKNGDDETITPTLPPRKFIVGLDYGTTFTSVSYTIHDLDDEHPRILPWDVRHISNWPEAGTNSASANQVPSESWYSAIPMDRSAKKHSKNGKNDMANKGAEKNLMVSFARLSTCNC